MKDAIYLICSKSGVGRMRNPNGVRRMTLKEGEIAVKVNVEINDELFARETPEVELKIK